MAAMIESEKFARLRKEAAQHGTLMAMRKVGVPYYVQYGSGHCAPETWLNFDASKTLRWERLPVVGRWTKNDARFPRNVRPGDVVKGLPIPGGTCMGVYASHVLEHLTRDDFTRALAETHRILRPTGIFRLVVPDLEYHARLYVDRLNSSDEAERVRASGEFMLHTGLGVERRGNGALGLASRLLNTSAHLWMWDRTSIRHELEKLFVRVRECKYGDCDDAMFDDVEDRGRFEDGFAMEARRYA